ncbi:MAG: hypothetical protein JWN67_2487 [Actinomycetia bacterium]|nr:hypothetical protein [Actinomycetes bacterium]
MRRFAAFVVLLVILSASPAAAVGRCDGYGPVQTTGHVATDDTEISGVAASRTNPGVWWVHDDSGGKPEVTAIDEAGADLGTYALAGAEAFDWEDIAAADGQLYVADIGDNGRQRKDPRVFRVAEPKARPNGADGTLGPVEVIHLAYPGGPVDAEALVVDPRSGDLYVLTKDIGSSKVFRAPADALVAGAHVTMDEVGRFTLPAPRSDADGLPGILVTGADVSPDGSTVLVRTYRSVLAFARPAGKPLEAAFSSEPCEAPQAEEAQGEAIGWAADGRSYLTLSEGEHVAVHRVAVTASPATTTTAGPEGAAASSSSPLSAVLAGVGVLIIVALVVSSRRRAGRPRTRGSHRP